MVAAVLALSLLVPPRAVPSPRPSVLVVIDRGTLEKHVDVSEVTREIRALWMPYADIDFVDHAPASRDGHDERVQLVLVDGPRTEAPRPEALAWITFLGPGRPEDVVTISISAARSLIARGRRRDRRVAQLPPLEQRHLLALALARGAAHEIGHYLLRSAAHTRTGLMRAQLTAATLMDDDRRVFRLEAPQIEALRRRTAATGLVVDADVGPTRTE